MYYLAMSVDRDFSYLCMMGACIEWPFKDKNLDVALKEHPSPTNQY